MKLRTLAVAFGFICAVALAMAQSPFDGTWALNQKKSQLVGDEITFSPAEQGSMKYSDSAVSYTFKTDGTPVDTPMGSQATWKQADPKTYDHSVSRKGNMLSESIWKISNDDKTLTVNSHGTKPNGEKWTDSVTYTRVGDGNGLAGTWKSTAVKIGSPSTITMKGTADGTFKMDISAEKAAWDGKMDGNDYPAAGPTVPEGLTLALTQTSPNSFKMVEKLKDKTLYIADYSVSSDGKTMTVKGTNGEGKEPTTEVWDKKK